MNNKELNEKIEKYLKEYGWKKLSIKHRYNWLQFKKDDITMVIDQYNGHVTIPIHALLECENVSEGLQKIMKSYHDWRKYPAAQRIKIFKELEKWFNNEKWDSLYKPWCFAVKSKCTTGNSIFVFGDEKLPSKNLPPDIVNRRWEINWYSDNNLEDWKKIVTKLVTEGKENELQNRK